jgi:hypothetical protein
MAHFQESPEISSVLQSYFPDLHIYRYQLKFLADGLNKTHLTSQDLENSIVTMKGKSEFDFKGKVGLHGLQGSPVSGVETALLALCMTNDSFWNWFEVIEDTEDFSLLVSDYKKWREEFKELR